MRDKHKKYLLFLVFLLIILYFYLSLLTNNCKMKKVAFINILIISILITSIQQLKSQSETSVNKIELIIQLAKFIDWSKNNEFSGTKQMLYVISDNKLPINYEIQSKRSAFYKSWQIICSDRISNFENGSVVFITKEKHQYVKNLIELSAQKDILTIAEDQQNFCSEGGMINIANENNGQKLEINYKIIQEKSLNISSKVLALAKIYNE